MTPLTIADGLRAELMSGSLRPGAELSQVALARRFGVSRIPVRDALRVLAGEGLVEIDANRGARVIELGPAEIREIYDLRILLECDCLRLATKALTPATLQEIDRVRRKSDLDAATPNWSRGDWEFHRAIYSLAGRPRQLAMIEGLRRACEMHVRAYSTMPAKRPQWLADHKGIVEWLRKDDTERAIEALRSHLESAANHLIEKLTDRLA